LRNFIPFRIAVSNRNDQLKTFYDSVFVILFCAMTYVRKK